MGAGTGVHLNGEGTAQAGADAAEQVGESESQGAACSDRVELEKISVWPVNQEKRGKVGGISGKIEGRKLPELGGERWSRQSGPGRSY